MKTLENNNAVKVDSNPLLLDLLQEITETNQPNHAAHNCAAILTVEAFNSYQRENSKTQVLKAFAAFVERK